MNKSPLRKVKTLKLKPGKYYIGDPSEFVQWRIYEDFLSKYTNLSRAAHFQNADGGMIVGNTGGDGLMLASSGVKYPVNAGVLGVVSWDLGAGTNANKMKMAKKNGFVSCVYRTCSCSLYRLQ